LSQEESRGKKLSIGKWILIIVFAVAVIAFFYFDFSQYLTLESLKENKDALQDYTEAHYILTVMTFIGIYFAQTSFAFPGGAILSLAAGFLFGTLLGTLYINIGATSGAAIVFLAARYLFHDAVERKFGERLASFQEGFKQNAFSYLVTIRLIPIFPFFLINLGCSLTRIRLVTYVTATAVGIIPGSLVYANAGKQLGTIGEIGDIASPGVLGAFILLGLLALVPVIYQKYRKSSTTEPQTQSHPAKNT